MDTKTLLRKQKSAVKVLEWLFDPVAYRREGRSYAIAETYIKLAIKYPNVTIYPRDHFSSHHADEVLLDMIRSRCKRLDIPPGCEFIFERSSFQYTTGYNTVREEN
jgi:hypothetical protein